MGITVAAVPNSMRGEKYLRENPAARAEDLLWAFEKEKIKAVIANIGGNDSERVLPYLKDGGIKSHPKIFIGYSDVMNLHLFCYRAGLSTFYGHNLLTTIAETPVMHPYSQYWFEKMLFHSDPIGEIFPSDTYSFCPFFSWSSFLFRPFYDKIQLSFCQNVFYCSNGRQPQRERGLLI